MLLPDPVLNGKRWPVTPIQLNGKKVGFCLYGSKSSLTTIKFINCSIQITFSFLPSFCSHMNDLSTQGVMRPHIVSFCWTNSDQFQVWTKDADTLILFLAWWLLILLLVPSRWLGVKGMVGWGTRNIPCCSEHLFHCIHTFKKKRIKTLLSLSILLFQPNTARLTPNTVQMLCMHMRKEKTSFQLCKSICFIFAIVRTDLFQSQSSYAALKTWFSFIWPFCIIPREFIITPPLTQANRIELSYHLFPFGFIICVYSKDAHYTFVGACLNFICPVWHSS